MTHEDGELPKIDAYAINDGYGVIGWGYTCRCCGHNESFVVLIKNDIITCEECGCCHFVDMDYE